MRGRSIHSDGGKSAAAAWSSHGLQARETLLLVNGATSHLAYNCKFLKSKCMQCSKIGHIKRVSGLVEPQILLIMIKGYKLVHRKRFLMKSKGRRDFCISNDEICYSLRTMYSNMAVTLAW